MTAIKHIMTSILIAMLMLSAIAVIYSKYQSRQLFIGIQQKEKQLDDYEVEWGRLQLELTTLTEENRIEIEIPKGVELKKAEIFKIFMDVDVYISIPVASGIPRMMKTVMKTSSGLS